MANYISTTVSNYFRVKDEVAYNELLKKVSADDIYIDTKEIEGELYHFIGGYGSIYGIENEDGDCDYDAFIDELKKCVHEEDVIILKEVGHEKLRYVTAFAVIIASNHVQYLDLDLLAEGYANQLKK